MDPQQQPAKLCYGNLSRTLLNGPFYNDGHAVDVPVRNLGLYAKISTYFNLLRADVPESNSGRRDPVAVEQFDKGTLTDGTAIITVNFNAFAPRTKPDSSEASRYTAVVATVTFGVPEICCDLRGIAIYGVTPLF